MYLSHNHQILIAAFTTVLLSGCLESTLESRLENHIEYLASDELEGREAGTQSEKYAAEYIANQFGQIGLEPAGTDGYFQDFEFLMGKTLGNNQLSLDGDELELESQYYPLNFSGNSAATGKLIHVGFGIEAPDLEYNDYEGIEGIEGNIITFSVSSPDGIHPHSKYHDYHGIRNRVKLAEQKGAMGVLLFNDDSTAVDPTKSYTEKMARVGIPVVFVTDVSLVKDKENATIEVELLDDERTARNVIGLLNNGAEQLAIIGAHYDHLGFGQNGGSLYRGDTARIHNGADDNASGTALMMEIARSLEKSQLKGKNFLFIAFSGEEKGLLGANYFTSNPTIDLDKVSHMINMDMVGRMDTTDYYLSINGVGTSPVWDTVIGSIEMAPIEIKSTESGMGSSDHTAFYLSDIPAIHFFTGTHEDYHKPSDDEELINYEGMALVHDYMMQINDRLDSAQALAFTKTDDSQGRAAPRFTVTLGVIPDYMHDDGGLKIDGVSEGKPANAAGILKDDILIKMGEYDIDDIYAYMDALSKFKKGDSTSAILMRKGEEVTVHIRF